MDINNDSLWNNSVLNETIKRLNMDPEKQYKFKKMNQALFDKTIDSDPQVISMEAATQIKLMLRDGLHPDLLEENEREIYLTTFGPNSLDEFYVNIEEIQIKESQKIKHKKSKKNKKRKLTLSPKKLEF